MLPRSSALLIMLFKKIKNKFPNSLLIIYCIMQRSIISTKKKVIEYFSFNSKHKLKTFI